MTRSGAWHERHPNQGPWIESVKGERRTRSPAAAVSTDAAGIGIELVGVRGFEPPGPSSRS
jgi:hypothetical protein